MPRFGGQDLYECVSGATHMKPDQTTPSINVTTQPLSTLPRSIGYAARHRKSDDARPTGVESVAPGGSKETCHPGQTTRHPSGPRLFAQSIARPILDAYALPNQLAADTDSRIMVTRLDVAHKTGHGRFCRRGSAFSDELAFTPMGQNSSMENANCSLQKPAIHPIKLKVRGVA